MTKIFSVVRAVARDPRAIYYYGQKSIRSYRLRRRVAALIGRLRRDASTSVDEPRQLEWEQALRRDGYVSIPELLTKHQVAEIRDHLAKLVCVDLAHPELGEFALDGNLSEHTRIARYRPEDLIGCPHLLPVANDPGLLAVVGNYLGCEPTMTLFEVWWSIPTADTQPGLFEAYQDYQFHRDVEDFRFVKLFIYLTDVGEGSGPHLFVSGSHSDGRLTQRASLDADDVSTAFGLDAQTAFTGSAGHAILEDTFGVHQARPPRDDRRLICSVTYSLTGLNPFSPKRPYANLPAGLPPYVNRLFCHTPARREDAAPTSHHA